MSYVTMDHAGWMENNNAAINRQRSKRKAFKALPERLTPFQAKVTNILGIVGNGIYNAPISCETIDWTYGFSGVSVIWNGGNGFSTFDFCNLTRLVFLCHEARIRVEMNAVAPRKYRISFWQRKADGGVSSLHPNLDEAVMEFRSWFTADHMINFGTEQRAHGAVTGEIHGVPA